MGDNISEFERDLRWVVELPRDNVVIVMAALLTVPVPNLYLAFSSEPAAELGTSIRSDHCDQAAWNLRSLRYWLQSEL